MDEWVEMMRSMPALQELDMEISSFLLQDQQDMMTSVGQGERATGRLQQYYTSYGDFKLELDDEKGSDHDKNFDHVLKPRSFSTDNEVGRNPLQQRHRFISPRRISAGSNASPDQTQDSQRTEQDVVGFANSAINNQVRQVGYQQARLKEEAMPALSFPPFHFPSVRYLTFRGINIVPELVGFLPNLESLAFEESPGEAPADSATNEDLPGDDDAIETAAGSSDESLKFLTDMISDRCPRITRLVLNESSLADNIQHLLRIPALLRAIPKLHCFVVSAQMIIRNQEIIPELLQSHRGHLQSFVILNDQEKQPDGAISSHQSSYYSPEQQAHGIANPEAARLRRQCLQVFESCPNLQVSDCKIMLPLQEIMVSIPNWPCRVTLRVLRLQIQELTGDGGMDMEEAAVTEMFIKSIFLGSLGQLVAIQYLVEHQLATMPYLERFYLGDTMISAPRRG
ncbi:hypothetical protein BG011_000029 [Mortierella polycephala]|uniref:Uncharacterized protein n=1 Tax=Mortierella polycephala TaxID=41804 RepID=A0A9P6UBD5_9FUNG|nr:hypothetical protein BG011_000029 [Mortierella polycephala]